MNRKKLVAGLFLAIYLLPITEVGEFFKIPALVIHFYSHKMINNHIGATTFTKLHYTIKEGKDQEKHDRLPFKSPSHPVVFSFLSPTPTVGITTSITPAQENMPAFCNHNDTLVPSQNILAIWQPPRFC